MEVISLCGWILMFGLLLRSLNKLSVGYIEQWDGVRYGSVKSGPAFPNVLVHPFRPPTQVQLYGVAEMLASSRTTSTHG